MSSTNRGATPEISEYYVTPVEQVELFLREWAKDEPELVSVKRILDPCAGGTVKEGKIHVPMSYSAAIHRVASGLFPASGFPTFHIQIDTMDIREDSAADVKGSYLTTAPANQPDLIISNPPFSLALDFVKKGLKDVRPGGFVVFLQRLNFLGSDKRKAFMQMCPPAYAYVHSTRMGFKKHLAELPMKERNATDSIEYAHFIWKQGLAGRFGQFRVI